METVKNELDHLVEMGVLSRQGLSRWASLTFTIPKKGDGHYYTFELDDESKDMCTIATSYGKYKYNHLLMGLKYSPDIVQQVMENLLQEIDDIELCTLMTLDAS
ncbi:hypothetical protein ACHAWF_000119 [Thalassiosira exigua]